MMKKIKYVLFLIVIMLSLSVCGVMAADNDDSVEILNSLGIIRGELEDIEADRNLTRSEAAVWIYNMVGGSQEYDFCVFEDVAAGTKSANAVMALYEMNIVSGDGTKFRPSDTITRNEFYAMLCNAIGYSDIARMKGGYPAGVVSIMSDLGISRGVSANIDALTVGQAARYMVNALEADTLGYGLSSNDISYKASGKKVMNEFLDIYVVKGWVEANSRTSLYSPNGAVQNGITIDGMAYKAGIDNADDLLGLYVEAYVHMDDNDDGTVVAAVRKPGKYKEIVIDAFDICDDSTRTYVDYEKGNKRDGEKISVTADIIYNGVAYPDATVDELYPDYGELRLLDRDSDNVFDLIFVTAYTPVISDGADAVTGKIINKYTGDGFESIIEIEQEDVVTITDVFGEPMELSDITVNTVAFVKKPKTGDATEYEIVLSQKSAKGEVLNVDYDEGTLTVGDLEYTMSGTVNKAIANNCIDALSLGRQYTFYFDIFDRVVYYEEVEEQKGYGYVYKIYPNDMEEEYSIKMFCADNEWKTIELPEKLYCDNVRMKAVDFVASARMNELVKYELDDEGRIKSLEYPVLTSVEDPQYMRYIKDGRFTKVNINNERWLLNLKSFEGKYYTPDIEYVFAVPSDGNTANFKMIDFSVSSESRYTLSMYELDEFSYGKIALVTATNDVSLSYTDNCMIVDKVKLTVVENEVVSVVYGFMNGQNVSFTGKDEHTFAGLKRGDIIRTKYNYGSQAVGYELVNRFGSYDVTNINDYTNISNNKIIKCYASDIDYNKKRIRMDDVLSGISYELRSDTVITVYDSINEVAKSGTINDLTKGDYIILRTRGGYFHELLIIKK